MELKRLKQKLKYDTIMSGIDLDMDTYNQKFAMWDYVVEHDLFAATNPNPLAINLLNDPTIYSYAFFKDDSGNRLKLTAYQDAIVNCIPKKGDPNDPDRFILFKASNQLGKSLNLCMLALYHALNEDNVNVVMVSTSLPQSQFLLANIRHRLNNSVFANSWKEDIGETANTTILTFNREIKDNEGKLVKSITNRIICAPKGEGLLGYPVHYLYLDEADFYEEAKVFFWKVAFPRCNRTKGQIILFSNPNPEISVNTSLLWELWKGDLFTRKFSFNFLDAPWNTVKEYETAKKNSPSYIFTSTHDGEFSSEGGGFFKYKEIKDMLQLDWDNQLPIVDRMVYLGLDLAKVNDQSVMALGISKPNKLDPSIVDIEVPYIRIFEQKTDYDVVIDEVKRVIDHYTDNQHGVSGIGFDATGVGKAVDDIMKMKALKATEVLFTLKNKNKMYGNFKLLAEQRRIKIVYDDKAEKQLSGLIFTRTAGGIMTVKHEKETIRDDIPDAIAVLIDVILSPDNIEPSLMVIQ